MISPVQQKLIDAQLAPAAIASQINASLAAKSLDAQKQQGAAILQLLDSAAQTTPPATPTVPLTPPIDLTA